MFAAVVKNTILGGLVILILHFLIKNELVDQSAKKNIDTFVQQYGPKSPLALTAPTAISPDDELAAFFLEARAKANAINGAGAALRGGSPRAAENKGAVDEDARRSANGALKDLYDYVYADTTATQDQLNALYKDTLRSDCIQGTMKTVKCDAVGNDPQDKRLCHNPVDDHIAKLQKAELPVVDHVDKGYRYGTPFKEYQDDNVMNGAFIEGTRLTGFDGNDMLFASVGAAHSPNAEARYAS